MLVLGVSVAQIVKTAASGPSEKGSSAKFGGPFRARSLAIPARAFRGDSSRAKRKVDDCRGGFCKSAWRAPFGFSSCTNAPVGCMVENRAHVCLQTRRVCSCVYILHGLRRRFRSKSLSSTAVDLDAFGATMNHTEVLALSCARQADRPVSVCRRMEMWAGQNDLRSVLTYWVRFPRYWSRSFKQFAVGRSSTYC